MSLECSVLPLGSIGTNCYLLRDSETGKGAVIDPGGEPRRLLAAIADSGMTLTAILLTHGHYDHTGAVAGLLEKFPGIPVWLHEADHALGDRPDAIMPDVSLATHFWQGGDTVQVGNETLTVLHTPGHTPGSVCLRWEDALFTGDTLFAGSCGRTDFPGGSTETILASLKRLAALPGDYQVCPGHERLSTLEQERQSNPYMKMALSR